MSYNFLADLYSVVENTTRQTGKTTALIEACKKIGGIFITHGTDMVRVLKKDYPNIDIRAPHRVNLRGNNKPIIFDHYLLYLILQEKYNPFYEGRSTSELEILLERIKKELVKRIIREPQIGVGLIES